MTTVNVCEANFSVIETCAAIALLGKRRSGKTSWAQLIIEKIGAKCNRFVVLCGTKDNMGEWKRIISPLYIMMKNIEYLMELKKYQEDRCAKFSARNLPIPKKYLVTIILDDCGFDRAFMHSKVMKDLLSNGRHYGMYIIILCQYLNQMHAENRDQLDYIGVLYTSNARNIKKVHEEYVNVCELRTFKYLLKALTSKKGLCWIDNTQNPTNISECVFYSSMPWPRHVTPVGNSDVRKFGDRHYIAISERKDSSKRSSKELKHSGECSINVDTDGEEVDDYEDLSNIISDRVVFNDHRGSFIVKKSPLPKEKTE